MKLRFGARTVTLPKAVPAPAELRPGGWTVLENKDGTRSRVMARKSASGWTASVRGELWHATVVDDALGSGAGEGAGGEGDLSVQFPGKVRQVAVKAGQKVAEGDTLVLVEAMKMEFAIKAPRAGVIARVLVTDGQQVGPGDRLVELAEETS